MSEPRPQDLEQQILEHRKAVDRDPGSPLFVPLAQAYLAVNNPAEALEVCRSGLAFLPDLPGGRLVLAKVLCRLGRLREAEAELAALVALAPNLDEALDLLAQLRAGQLVTLDIRPAKLPPPPLLQDPDKDDDEEHTRGLMRPAKSAGHPSVEELGLDDLEEEEEPDEFPSEKTIGQGAPIPVGLRQEPSEEAIEGQQTVQGKPLRPSGPFTPPAKHSGDFAAVMEDDDDDGESTRPLIDMKQQTEARLSWQERSKLIQEGQGGLADLFSAGKGKDAKPKEPSRSSILSPEYRKALSSSNPLGSTKDLVTTELRKSGEMKLPAVLSDLQKLEGSGHPSSMAELRRDAEPSPEELKAMPSFRSSASFKSLGVQKSDSKSSLAAAVKSALEMPPPEPPPEPPKRRTQVVAKANKPMFSALEEVKAAIPTSEEAGAMEPSVNAPLQPQQKFPTAPLVQVAKHKPIIEFVDTASPYEDKKPFRPPTNKDSQSPHGQPSAPQKAPSGSLRKNPSQPANALRSSPSGQSPPAPDYFATPPISPTSSPAWQEQLINPSGLTPLGPQEIPMLPPEKKAPKTPWALIGAGVAVFLAILVGIFFVAERQKKRDEVSAILGAVEGLVAEGNAAGLLSAEEILEKAVAIDPNDNQVLSKIALVEGLRLLVLQEERVERLGDALARASANQFSDENILLGHIALTSQSDLKRALSQAQDARVKDANSALLAFAEGFLQSELGKLTEGEVHFKAALSLSPGFSWAQLSLAEYYTLANRPELYRLLEDELRERPGNTRAQALALLRGAGSKGLPNESDLKEQLRRAFRLSLGKREAEWVRLALARYFYLQGEDKESEQYAEAFLRTPAQSPLVAVLAAELFYAKGQHSAAKDNLTRASLLLPESYWAIPLTEALINTRRIAEVEPVLAKVPAGSKSRYLRGRLLLLLKDSARASVELSAALKEEPTLLVAALYGSLATLSNQNTNITTINGLMTQLNSLGIPAEPPRVLPAPYPRALPLLVRSKLLKAQNKPEEAQSLITQAMRSAPKDEQVIQANNEQ